MKKFQIFLIALALALLLAGVSLVCFHFYKGKYALSILASDKIKVEYRPMQAGDMAVQDQKDFNSGFRYYGLKWDFPSPVDASTQYRWHDHSKSSYVTLSGTTF